MYIHVTTCTVMTGDLNYIIMGDLKRYSKMVTTANKKLPQTAVFLDKGNNLALLQHPFIIFHGVVNVLQMQCL